VPRRLPLLLLTALACMLAGTAAPTAEPPSPRQAVAGEIRPTAHRAVGATLEEYWFVPAATWRPARADTWNAARDLAKASELIAGGKAAQAVPLIRPAALASTPLAGYANYLDGLAQERLDRRPAARAVFTKLLASKPTGALADSVHLRLGELADADGDFAAAAAIYEALLGGKPGAPDDLLLRMMRASRSAGDTARAASAWQTLHYDWPTSEAAAIAEKEMPSGDPEPLVAGSRRFERELARAEKLFAARRYAPARATFTALLPHASGDAGELVSLRLAECDVHLGRLHHVRDDLRLLFDSAARRAEARYYDLLAARDLGRHDEFASLVRMLVDAYPDSSWSEDALNALATYLIVDNQDARAAEVLRELAARFPAGRYTARALWRTGWWAYRDGRFAEAADVFDRAAAAFPRSDYRPSYLYWAAKARDNAGDTAAADARFRLTVIEYANSYYGRQSSARLTAHGIAVPGGPEAARSWPGAIAEPDPPQNVELLHWLIAAEMYDSALAEVQHAERTRGSSPMLQATRAYLLNRTGALRPAINLMRQVYPQFLAAGGETLPPEILKIIYPADYWPLIRAQAEANRLDPFLVAALIAQESTFDKDAKSGANAYGLMQIVPATGKRWAKRLGIRNYSTRALTVPDVNVRIGTAYFADLVKQFSSVHVALAGYNAGDSRAAKWASERRGLPQDEFIDDIPFPETQAYVRRILGSAEDYRRLYGGVAAAPPAPAPPPVNPNLPKPVIIKPPVKTP